MTSGSADRFSSDSATYDVVGIGNALVDVIAHGDDDLLLSEDLVKGSMALIDTERANHLYKAVGSAIEMSGGSAANTMCGVASFGGRAAYVGKVSHDDLGDVFGHDLRAVGVTFAPGEPDGETPTGRCIIVVTPDGQRTMSTYLGVSSFLCPSDIGLDIVASGKVLYMEGYLFDRDDAKEAFRTAARAAHAAGRMVSLTLSDSFCVDRHRADFRDLVRHNCDLVFGNSDELVALYEVDTFDQAIAALRADGTMGAITRGKDGSVIVTADEVITVSVEPIEHLVDTTGAGDLYAAGFLYGFANGQDLAECGRLGSIAAAEVISHVGARPLVDLRKLV